MQSESKLATITYYLAKNVSGLSPTKWNKLLFFLEGAFLCQHDHQISGVQFIKMPYGPVVSNYTACLQRLHESQNIQVRLNLSVSESAKVIQSGSIAPTNTLDSNEQAALEKVVTIFGTWTAAKLSNFSHLLEAWKKPQMFQTINLKELKSDTFLAAQFKEPDFGRLVLG